MSQEPVDVNGNPPAPTAAGDSSAYAYNELAGYYDLVHAHVKSDIPLYLSLARESGGPILELGCGSGRTLVPLAEAGFEIVGLDNSKAMLARARERIRAGGLEGSVQLMEGEMVSFDLGKRFPLITVPFNTWMHLSGQQTQAESLRCIARHLLPGGQLVIDLPAPSTIVDVEHDGSMVLEGIFPGRVPGERLLQFSSTKLDMEQQILHVTWIYDLVKSDGAVKRTVAPMQLCYLFPRQAKSSLKTAGLAFKAFWGDHNRTPYSAASKNLIILAEQTVE